ncbi:MAG: TRIC cation channel family protein, partial [Luteimonas sp.]|nr:TRIC cation channel family protein [Luteimonas sp.]
IAYMVACGGGIIRDVCIGAIPPAGLADWRYLTLALIAAGLAMAAYPLLQRLDHPVQMFDALGLGFFAVFGAHKTLLFGHNAQVAIVLGIVSAVGGGALRDVLLNRTPLILRKEIYASAAVVAAVVQVSGERLDLTMDWVPWVGIVLCFGLRYLAMRHHWNLPRFSRAKD